MFMRLASAMTVMLLTLSLPVFAADAVWVASARSGAWSELATWDGGKVPTAGARVHVKAGHVVVYDVKSEAALRAVYVAGTLSFAADRDTRLDVGVLKVEAGDEPTEHGLFDQAFHGASAQRSERHRCRCLWQVGQRREHDSVHARGNGR